VLLRNADLAMHLAKSEAQGNLVAFDPSIERQREARRAMESALGRALDEQRFQLEYQPKFDLATGRLSGAEALLRWSDPAFGKVPPDTFIPIAEQMGMITGIGAWVIDAAVRQVVDWRDNEGFSLQVAVDVSPLQLRCDNIVATLEQALQRHDLDPALLQIELTESALLEDDTQTHALMGRIAGLGCELALDDFGTGYSALGYLNRFPFDCLKLDRSFISGMLDNERDSALTRTIISMAHTLGMRVGAEGVELPGHRVALAAYGCDIAQGYLFSRPLPADEFRLFVASLPEETGSGQPSKAGGPGSLASLASSVRVITS